MAVVAPGSITIRGTLMGDAQVRLTPGPEVCAWVFCDVKTGDHDAPVHVQYRVPGVGYVPQVSAKVRAERLRKGCAVQVRAGGIVARPFGGLMARDVEYISSSGADDGVAVVGDRVTR